MRSTDGTQLADKLELKCFAWTVRRILFYVDWLFYTKMDYNLPLTREKKKVRQLWPRAT